MYIYIYIYIYHGLHANHFWFGHLDSFAHWFADIGIPISANHAKICKFLICKSWNVQIRTWFADTWHVRTMANRTYSYFIRTSFVLHSYVIRTSFVRYSYSIRTPFVHYSYLFVLIRTYSYLLRTYSYLFRKKKTLSKKNFFFLCYKSLAKKNFFFDKVFFLHLFVPGFITQEKFFEHIGKIFIGGPFSKIFF